MAKKIVKLRYFFIYNVLKLVRRRYDFLLNILFYQWQVELILDSNNHKI